MALWHLLGVAGEAAPIHRKHVPSCITSKPCIALAGPLQCAVGTSVSASAGDHMDMYGDCTTSGTEDGRNVVVTAKEECGKTSMQATKISREIHRQGRTGLLVCARVDIGVDGGGMQSGGRAYSVGGGTPRDPLLHLSSLPYWEEEAGPSPPVSSVRTTSPPLRLRR